MSLSASSPTNNPLAKNVLLLPSIGEKTAQALAKAQIFTIYDLLLRVPKSVLSQEENPGFALMEPGRHYVASGRVYASKTSGMGQKRRLEVILQDETGKMSAVFFGPAVNYAQKILKNDAIVTVAGEAKDFLGRIQMVHPKLLNEDSIESTKTTIPTYSQLSGLQPALFKRIIIKAIDSLKTWDLADHASPTVLKPLNIALLKEAMLSIHEPESQPPSWDERASCPFFRRLAFEELVSFYLRLNLERNRDKDKNALAIPLESVSKLALGFLPFTLTSAQEKSCREIIANLNEPQAMARLLQGDVGSGKTAVSAIAARHVVTSGLQVAVMAPTEILAEQLFKTYQGFFGETQKIALLTASTKTKERRAITEALKNGELLIAVGTHALLSEDVSFKRLGLVIIDEQHRFGVKQRAHLLQSRGEEQGFTPHLLVMSATPIPRSLALTIYGDLELSVIDERPPGRIPIHTQILSGPVLNTLEKLGSRIIESKQKAFIVFPLVEESENLDLENATKALAFLKEKFGENSAALLHGKMKADEKALAMARFKNNEVIFLVSTTVVEVGVDIPDATCMAIAHPERFGLAQLHQLRGRVGRKDLKSFCFLLTDNKFGPSFKRLNALCQSDNGFKLAEIDLEIRGAGELLGTRQSGLPNFLIFDHSIFADLVSPAKAYARSIEKALDSSHLHLYQGEAHFC